MLPSFAVLGLGRQPIGRIPGDRAAVVVILAEPLMYMAPVARVGHQMLRLG